MEKIVISDDQNTVTIDGVESKFKEGGLQLLCDDCVWNHRPLCQGIPCKPYERSDNRRGFYVKKDTPAMGREQLNRLKDAAAPLIKYLNENHHPHVTAIVTLTSIELLEGVMVMTNIYEFLND